ncbi:MULTISPECIES: DUF2167 domain-containing protein [unclassified Spirosoma]|uniref:DUF2167 domain-containing protein n=1 Tax=unclassified Spirosoma TaxID=2621999 RepID=UPI000962392A|nr:MULTISPECIES: DUF2167 domain-containing protein [unclassified Spirosoma]MBN8826932.1 DUF2167 domain-containing protein [Spirosoma sp.]OJW74693.1 MAG: hypothetical protein BGO59_28030 [Spirosoma sp. 48-14]
MTKFIHVLSYLCVVPALLFAQADPRQAVVDSINRTFSYQTGTILLNKGMAKLTVPKGFKFLDATQSRRVLVDIWGNPADVATSTQGMLFPLDGGPIADKSWAFNVTYDEMGYVKDEDADDIDYADLLEEMKEGTEEASKERIKNGYESIALVGWASAPYYDKAHKVLHWAKEIKFGDTSTINTLNYDVRILGRKGVMSLNAIASMDELPLVKQQIPGVIGSVTFEPGNKYTDFDPKMDVVAAVGIGGLVAGKVLAKAGFFALLLKFWKLIVVTVAGGFSALRRFLFSRKVTEEPSSEAS